MNLRGSKIGLTLLAYSAFAGCHAPPPVTRDSLVGNYVYKSEDPEQRATDHQWDHLTLQADGKYELAEGGPTKSKSHKAGMWIFYRGDPAEVTLDHSGYPAELHGDEVRLLIDEDVGIWYVKAK